MSEGDANRYRLDQVSAAAGQIRAIADAAKRRGKLDQFINILKQAAHQLQTDPHGWGDPEYRSASADGIVCRFCLRGDNCCLLQGPVRRRQQSPAQT
jgi:hypothetical protein